MRRIAIVIGHGPNIDTGAVNEKSKMTELKYNTELARRIRSHIMEKGGSEKFLPLIVNRTTEKLQPVAETNATGADLAVELHCNCSDGRATGTEMIHYAYSSISKRLAEELQEAAVGVLGLKDRGVKPPWMGRGERWLKQTTMPAVIVESFFIDNDDDLKTGLDCIEALARAYGDVLMKFQA